MIEPEKRKAIFLLHQEGMAVREISRRLDLGRNTVRRIIGQEGRAPARAFTPDIDPDLLRQLHAECNGYVQRVWEKLQEEHGLKLKYSTLTRWLRLLGISLPARARDATGCPMNPAPRCSTTPVLLRFPWAQTPTKLQASLLYLRYSKRRYLQFYRVFDRFQMKCFLHRALLHWGYAPPVCIIDNTNLARLRGLGAQAVIVPEMEAFAKSYGFRFLCHAPKHSDRKAGEERSFLTVETNFLPGRTFSSLEDLNRQALEWSTVRMEQRPQGKPGLIPAKAFEYERGFLQQLPPHLPAPYKLLERSVDEYGYVAVEANYYWVPGTGRGEVRVLRYDQHLEIYQSGQLLMQYPLLPEGVRNQPVHPPGQPASRYQPRHRQQLQRSGAKAPAPDGPRRQRLCRFYFGQPRPVASPAFAPVAGLEPAPQPGVVRAQRRARPSLPDHQPGHPRTDRPVAVPGRSGGTAGAAHRRVLPRPSGLSGRLPDRLPRPLPI